MSKFRSFALRAAAGLGAAMAMSLTAWAAPLSLPVASDVNVVNEPSVTVANPPTAPVPVRDVDYVAQQPFTKQLEVGMSYGTQRYGCTDFRLPAGKRWVIQHVSAESVVIFAGNALKSSFTTQHDGDLDSTYLDLHKQDYAAEGPLWIADQQVLAFVDPDTTLQLCAWLAQPQSSDTGNFGVIIATFTGYLVAP